MFLADVKQIAPDHQQRAWGTSHTLPLPSEAERLVDDSLVFSWPWGKTAWAAAWGSSEGLPGVDLSKLTTPSKQQSLGHFILLRVLCGLGWCQHLCFRQGYGGGAGKCMAGDVRFGWQAGTWGVISKFAVAPSLKLVWGLYCLWPSCTAPAPETQAGHMVPVHPSGLCVQTWGMRNKRWIWLTFTVLAFRLPLHVSEISMSVNISVLQRRYYLCCIICEKSLPQNLICGSINL